MYNIHFILFYFIKITTCFDHFIRSSSGEYKMCNKCSLELQTTLRHIWANIYNDLWWMTLIRNFNILMSAEYVTVEVGNCNHTEY
jgi:hypothetical protein